MATRKISQPQTADPGSDQFLHLVSDLVKHPANLPVDSLPEDNPEPRRFNRVHHIDARSLPIEHHAAGQFGGERRIPRAIQGYLIFLFDFVARMGQTLREVAVVGQEQQSLSLSVEPADTEKPRELWRQEIENGVVRVGIRPRGNEAGRFVQKDMKRALAVHELAADFDVVALRRLRAEVRANAAVYRDATVSNQLVAMPARTDAGGGEETVQSHEKS